MKEKYSLFVLIMVFANTLTFIISNILEIKGFNIFGIQNSIGTFLFPVVYITSDIIQEFGGYKLSRQSNILTIISQIIVSIIFYIAVIIAPNPESEWVQESLATTLGVIPSMTIASLISLYIGDLLNDIVFAKIRQKTKDTSIDFAKRAYLSSLVGRVGDSLLFPVLAFLVLPALKWSWLSGEIPVYSVKYVLYEVAFIGFIKMNIYEFIMLPISTFIVKKVRENGI